jgi:hypothetical protein
MRITSSFTTEDPDPLLPPGSFPRLLSDQQNYSNALNFEEMEAPVR